MATIEVQMPKMGESIIEATIIQWSKNVGDNIEYEETLLEIATDKVDSEIPAPTSGVLVKTFFEADEVVAVGTVIALIETESGEDTDTLQEEPAASPNATTSEQELHTRIADGSSQVDIEQAARPSVSKQFYSPLVRSIAAKENVDLAALNKISGTGHDSRVTKKDLLDYVDNRDNSALTSASTHSIGARQTTATQGYVSNPISSTTTSVSGEIEIIEMDRTRRLIAEHMVRSKQTSPHVTSFIEVDVTNIVDWRNQVKHSFKENHQENITYTPIFIEAVAKAIQDFPLINVSVDGTKIIVKKTINIGMATALPSGNLIVPVIKDAAHLSLFGLIKKVNDLAQRARANQLKPGDIQGGTFTLTNVGTFGNVMGTPIINQPQVAILSVGAIRKKPAILETEYGDVIAIRQMMFLSLSYDHRVVDGMLGGSFLRKVRDYLEAFSSTRTI